MGVRELIRALGLFREGGEGRICAVGQAGPGVGAASLGAQAAQLVATGVLARQQQWR